MGVGQIGNGAPSIMPGAVGKTTRADLENMINQLKKQREEYQRLRNDASGGSEIKPHSTDKVNPDKRINDIDNRLKNLQGRLDKLEEKQEIGDGKCETCENRKYQDVSDDSGVSFQSPTKVSPQSAAGAVRGHEYEHVSRNQAKAARDGQEIVYQNVRIKTAICPECGKSYVAGGETTTVTKTKPEQPDVSEINGENKNKPEGINKEGKKPDFAEKAGFKDEKNDKQNYENRFSVGLYDKAYQMGQLLNIVA